MNRRIIVHFPFKINKGRAAASQLRPQKIIAAFEELGYEIFLIEGEAADRNHQMKSIKRAIKSGVHFDFMYSESSTLPTLMTEKHHFPTHPSLDFSLFRFCKKRHIPIGLFYRDIYWCFPENNKGVIRKFMRYFYLYDLYEYNKYVSTLFVPSFEMVEHIPYSLKMPVHELYPGCEVKTPNVEKNNSKKNHVNILYVGGIGHHYNVSMILDVVKKVPQVHLTLCCRPDDWKGAKSEYEKYLGDNVSVVHKSGKELEQLYAEADLFCLYVRPDKYREFAVPFKLFETIGYGCPVLASEGTWVAKFVKQNRAGFTCEYSPKALKALLEQLNAHTEDIKLARTFVSQIRNENNWEARCKKIEDVLLNINEL